MGKSSVRLFASRCLRSEVRGPHTSEVHTSRSLAASHSCACHRVHCDRPRPARVEPLPTQAHTARRTTDTDAAAVTRSGGVLLDIPANPASGRSHAALEPSGSRMKLLAGRHAGAQT